VCAFGTGSTVAAQPPATLTIPNASVQPVILVGTGTLDQKGTVRVHFIPQRDGTPTTDPTVAVALPYTSTKPLPVSLPYTVANPMPSQLFYTPASPLPIEIASVRKAGNWDPLRASVEDAATKKTPGRD
jgi:hypothetical protein